MEASVLYLIISSSPFLNFRYYKVQIQPKSAKVVGPLEAMMVLPTLSVWAAALLSKVQSLEAWHLLF